MLPPWPIGTNHSACGPATSRSPTSREDGNETSLRLRRGSRACCCRRGADGRRQNRRRKCNNAHGLADDRCTGARLGRCGRAANRCVRGLARRRQRQGRDPDLGRASDEARRIPCGRSCSGRGRAREHGDDQVHGGGRAREPDGEQGALPEQQDLAQRAQGLVHVPEPALLRAVLRRCARRHLPEGPLRRRGHAEGARVARRVHRRRQEGHGAAQERSELLRALLPGQVLVRRDVVRL